jgi:hypothetical protein
MLLVVLQSGCLSGSTGPSRLEIATASLPPPLISARDTWTPADRVEAVALTAAIDEVVHFAVGIRAANDVPPGVRVRMLPAEGLDGHLPADSVTVYRVVSVAVPPLPGWYIRTVPPGDRERERLDVLIPWDAPIGGLASALLPGRTCRVWVEVHIPKGTAPGSYGGELQIISDDATLARVPYAVDVLPLVLPVSDRPFIVEVDHRKLVAQHIRATAGPVEIEADNWSSFPESGRIDLLIRDTMRELQRHRLCPVLPGLMPMPRMLADGELALDWTTYDRVVGPLMDGSAFDDRMPLPAWPMPIDRFIERAAPAGGVVTPGRVEALTATVGRALSAGYAERGWLSRAYAMAPSASAERPEEQFELARRFAGSLSRADYDVRVVSTLPPQDMKPLGWPDYPWTDLTSVVDIFAPPAQFYDSAAIRALPGAPSRGWFGVDRPPYSGSFSIHARPADVLVLPWQGRRLGAGAILGGLINDWPASPDPQPADCVAHSPQVLLYPGGCFGLDRPVPTVRLKLLRRAMQDVAYARLLEQRGLDYVAIPLAQALAIHAGTEAYRTHFADGRPHGWPASGEVFDSARTVMLEALRDQAAADPVGGAAAMRRTTAWRRFVAATRRVSLDVEGVRIRGERRSAGGRADASGPASGVSMELSVVVHNGDRAPISGVLSLADVPDGWDAPEKALPSIPVGEARRVVLEAWAPTLEVDASGALSLPLIWRAEDGESVETTARLASAMAVRRGQEIAIDGDLADWPVGRVNVLADFVPIAATTGPAGHPLRATMALVLRDEDYLYVGVLCESDPARPDETKRKGVRYDDLVPMGEELVELLIDPHAIGTRSPSDLYHIVIKRSGADLAEKGIAFQPPCGRREPWPVDLAVSVRSESGRWMAELRIPIAAFGEHAGSRPVWGFNVTRFDAANEEFSTWSGATGNAYDPYALGNLWMP